MASRLQICLLTLIYLSLFYAYKYFFFWEGIRQILGVLEIFLAFPKFIQENVDIGYVQLAWAVN